MSKTNLLVSFSGGETSAYMAQWLWKHKQDEYNMVFVMANTGQENYETIQFARQCSEYFGFKLHFIEAVVNPENGKGTTHIEKEPWNLVMLEIDLFEAMIKKYGIPNVSTPHCTRELKANPIKSFGKSYFKGEKYQIAIGIRADEIDRMSSSRKKLGIIYPLISNMPMTKPKINFWWHMQPFRLELEGYQGNCVACYKKSNSKLFKTAKKNPMFFNGFGLLEGRYGHFIPESRIKIMLEKGLNPEDLFPITFFRGNRSAYDIIMQSKDFDGNVIDDSQNLEQYDLNNESCEVFTECGTDN